MSPSTSFNQGPSFERSIPSQNVNWLWDALAHSRQQELLQVHLFTPYSKHISDPLHFWGSTPNWIYSYDKLINLIPVSLVDNEAKAGAEQWLEGYSQQGYSYLLKQNTSHSFVLYDQKRQQVVLWRSSQSIEPIYWSIHQNQLLFSPALSSLLQTGLIAAKHSKSAIAEYLYFGFVPDDACLLEGINKLSPGQGLVYNLYHGNCWHIWEESPWLNSMDKPTLSLDNLLNETLKTENSRPLPKVYPNTDPLCQIWHLQEPRSDLWTVVNYEDSQFPLNELNLSWLQDFGNAFVNLRAIRNRRSWPLRLQQLGAWLETKIPPSDFGKYLRFKLLPVFYRSLDSYYRQLERWCVFNARKISLDFVGLHCIMSPYTWLQEHLQNFLPAFSQHGLSQNQENALLWTLLQLSARRTIHPLWTMRRARNWQYSPWPWSNHEHARAVLESMHYGIPSTLTRFKPKMQDHLSSLELANTLSYLRESILIDESIIPGIELYKLCQRLREDISPDATYSLQRQASCLIALELWLRIFIDLHGRIPSQTTHWQQLLGIPCHYP